MSHKLFPRKKNVILTAIFFLFLFSFPSICFSESKTIEYEHCGTYLGDMKNKKELDDFREGERILSITGGLFSLTDPSKNTIKFECIRHIFSNYLEKVVVVSHTEKGRNICNKIRLTFDPKVVDKYLSQENCIVPNSWYEDIDFVLTKKSDKINIGLIIETKIPDIDEYKKEMLENKEESQFHRMIKIEKDKYKVVDRRHLSKILEEQKLSSSGITDSETVKLGKLLNLDIIVFRVLYDKSQVTKVLDVQTGEVLFFKTYGTETEKGWVFFSKSEDGEFYYDKQSMTKISPNVVRVWMKSKYAKVRKDRIIQMTKKDNLPMDGWDKFDYDVRFCEVDCKNYTIKTFKIVSYNDKGKVLEDFDFSSPTIDQIVPESMGDLLLRKVCQR